MSLLCPSIKVLERLVLPYLNLHLSLFDTHHGFRKQRSTTSALLPMAHKVATGFNKPRTSPLRTVALTIDVSKAFDTVYHMKLVAALSTSSLHHNVIKWLSSYLRGHHASHRYSEATSNCHDMRPAYHKVQSSPQSCSTSL